ncbi:MAG: Tfp pilus assembly protein FimT/FimU [Crocosphaera sp.]
MTNLVENQLSPKTIPKLLRLLKLSAVSTYKPNQGVTLLEIVIATVITGILAGIGTPSLMSMIRGDQVRQGLDQIQLALQDAQKRAIQSSKKCTIVIKTNGPLNIDIQDPSSKHCLGGVKSFDEGKKLHDRKLPNSVAMTTTDGTETTIKFSFKGNMAGTGKTIVVKPAKGKGDKRCLVITQGLGIMRSGIYDPNEDDSRPKAEHCYRSYQTLNGK